MLENINNHIPIYIGLGLSSLTFFGYLLKNSSKNKQTSNSKQIQDFSIQQKQIHRALIKLQKTRQLYKQRSKEFQLNYVEEVNQKVLTEDCIIKLLQTCNQLFDKEQLQKIYKISREARRNIFQFILPNAKTISRNRLSFDSRTQNKLDESAQNEETQIKQNLILTQPQSLHYSELYYRFVCTFQEQIKYFIQKTQKDFVVFLNIPFSLVTESIDYHLAKQENENFKNNIQQWTSSVRQILKTYLTKYNQTIELPQIKQILQFQIEVLRTKQQKIIQMIKKLGITNDQELQCVPTFLAVYLEDLVFKRYSIQQEQMTIDIMHISSNQDMRTLVHQFQQVSELLVKQMYEEVKRQTILDHSDYF